MNSEIKEQLNRHTVQEYSISRKAPGIICETPNVNTHSELAQNIYTRRKEKIQENNLNGETYHCDEK